MVYVAPGTFVMGSPPDELDRYPDEAQHAVTISHGFWIGKYAVTQGEYKGVTGEVLDNFQGDNYPIWGGYAGGVLEEKLDPAKYCEQLTLRERAAGKIPATVEYRLPSEEEWEYACRAGTSTRFSYGDDNDYSRLGDYAWYSANAEETVHPVGKKLPNPWGLYDMHGNVWELCLGSTGIFSLPYRGGDIWKGAWACRSANRGAHDVGFWNGVFGFRVVLAPLP